MSLYASKFGKLSHGHRTGKGQFSFQSQGKAMLKNVQTVTQLHLFHTLAFTGEGNGDPLQCSCLENPRDGGAWWAAIYGIRQSRTRLKRLSSSSSSSSKVMLKILQTRLQWYVNCELPDVQTGFRKGRGTRDQIANIHWIIEKAREFQKISASLTALKPLTIWITTNCGKFLKRWEYQTTLPVSCETLCGSRSKVRTGFGTMEWFKFGKGVHQGCISSPCLFNFYAEYIMRNAQAGTKIAGRTINNLRYAGKQTSEVL